MSSAPTLRAAFAFGLCLLAACAGEIDEPAAVQQPSAAGSSAPLTPAGTPIAELDPADPPGDVNRVDLHRLNNAEYDNTLRDLLGVDSTPAASFIGDEKALGFDNIAAALGMTDAQYEQYWNAADALVERVFADAALRARIVTCDPGSADPSACTRSIIARFGLRAFRRPLEPEDIDPLVDLAADARALGEPFAGSIAHVVKAMLSSAQFLYRVELDPDPNASLAHRLNPYELASRLSYLVWSSMPDERLFALAESGELERDETLAAELERMLEAPRAAAFVSSFAGQWLGLRDLASHQVEAAVFPEWSEPLRDSMVREGQLYFDEFLRGDRSIDDFFTAPLNFVDTELAELYGIDGVRSTEPQRLTSATTARRGFMGLAGFLTLTSFSYRTAPTLRGKWVLENLLCEEIAPPPPNIPELDEMAANGGEERNVNVRDRLAEHRANPVCASCHTILDPIGLGLENFDAIGRHRTAYAAGEPVDASGMLPSGDRFNGLTELSALLARDRRLPDCASEKLLTYALSRKLEESDEPYLRSIRTSWAVSGRSLRSLLGDIIQSDPFRMRRGEPAQP